VHLAEVFIEEFDVAPSDVQAGRTVAEDALQAEDIPPVGQERARERVAQDMRRATHLQSGPLSGPPHDLLDAGCRQWTTAVSDKQGGLGSQPAASEERAAQGAAGRATERHAALLGSLAHHPTVAGLEVDVADLQPGQLAQADPRIEEQQQHGRIPLAKRPLPCRRQQGSYVRVAQRVDQGARDARRLEPLERMAIQIELRLEPAGEGAQRAHPAGQAGRRRRCGPRTQRHQPPASDRRRQVVQSRRTIRAAREAAELAQEHPIPGDGARAAAFGAQRLEVVGDQVVQHGVE